MAMGLTLVTAILGDMSILTHQTSRYLEGLILTTTMISLWRVIYRPWRIIEVDLGTELKKSAPVNLRDLSVGCHIVRGMRIWTQQHGLIYRIDSHDLDGIQVAHNTKDFPSFRGWLGMSPKTSIRTTLRMFLEDYKDLKLVDYPCQKSVDTTVMVDRIAEVVLSSENYYYLLRNNCESFVLYCKYDWVGEQLPHQINRYCHPYVFFFVAIPVMVLIAVYNLVVNGEIKAVFAILAGIGMVSFLRRQIFGGPAERAYVETLIRIEELEPEEKIGLVV